MPEYKQMSEYKHWKLLTDSDHILWLTIDQQGSSVNTLNQAVLSELKEILQQIAFQQLSGVVIQSGKKSGFIFGADIKQFTDIQVEEEAYALVLQAQEIFDRLAALTIPTIALIQGICLGGGLELSLACRYRIVEEGTHTQLGLPEVKLGLHPGWGGTVRLPRLIGSIPALKIMLSGKTLSAKEAYKVGLVNAVVPLRELERAARYYVIQQPKPHSLSWFSKWDHFTLARHFVGEWLVRKLSKRVNRNYYPAPYAIIHNWIQNEPSHEALIREAKSISELMIGETSQQLLRVFFLRKKLKDAAKKSSFTARHVHVIGAGTMGGDIAAWCALKGLRVTLHDQSPQYIAPAIKRAYQLFRKKCDSKRLVQAALDRLNPDSEGVGSQTADVVIEAVYEKVSVKQQVLKELVDHLKPDTLLATNTSSIPLEELASVLPDTTHLIGLHFFNPVEKMQLVEVVYDKKTPSGVIGNAAAFINQIDRLPLPVLSQPGFLVNRILTPYLIEAVTLLKEGVSPAEIDEAAVDFGMPMGPLHLIDMIGLDICLSVLEKMNIENKFEVPDIFKKKIAAGHLGKKTGEGFYSYKNGRKQSSRFLSLKTKALEREKVMDPLIFRLLNEAVACWAENIVGTADEVDAGAIFGMGFPPFRGGPLQYIKTSGVPMMKKRLEQLAASLGNRFKPHAGWDQLQDRHYEKNSQ